jgi:hypothetical protein
MLNVHEFKAQDLQCLSPDALAAVATKLLQHIAQQSKLIMLPHRWQPQG